jgi:hypothetical protein
MKDTGILMAGTGILTGTGILMVNTVILMAGTGILTGTGTVIN